eukprot:609515-Rhodomonas_salina.2
MGVDEGLGFNRGEHVQQDRSWPFRQSGVGAAGYKVYQLHIPQHDHLMLQPLHLRAQRYELGSLIVHPPVLEPLHLRAQRCELDLLVHILLQPFHPVRVGSPEGFGCAFDWRTALNRALQHLLVEDLKHFDSRGLVDVEKLAARIHP